MNLSSDLCELLQRCTDKTGRFRKQGFMKSVSEVMLQELSDTDLSPLEAFHLLRMGLDDIPLCPVCKTPLKRFWRHNFCSKKCALVSDETKQRREDTNLKRYGKRNASMVPEIKEKKKQTCLKNHGVPWPMQSEGIREKSKQSLLESYGVDVPAKSETIKKKMRETCLERYGTEFPQSLESVKEKIVQTNLSRYGVDCGLQNKFVQETRKLTCMKRLGVPWPSQSELVKCKIRMAYRKKNADKFMNSLSELKMLPLFDRDEYIESSELHFRCLECNHEFSVNNAHFWSLRCPNCYKNTRALLESKFANEITKFYTGEIIRNSRKIISPYELDVYIPEHNLAIEFNGIYWHSEEIRGRYYHRMKTDMCRKNGIRLIHINENEWLQRKNACISLVQSALGIYQKHIKGCDCSFIELHPKEYCEFLQENDFRYVQAAPKMYGLKYENEIMAAAGFRRNILERFAVRNGILIDDALDILLMGSEKHHVIYFMDISKQAVFMFQQFKQTEEIPPMIIHDLESDDETMIFDCGWQKLEWRI